MIEKSLVRISQEPLQNLAKFVYPTFPVSFGRYTISLLSGVYARGRKKFRAGGKCIICRGLHIPEKDDSGIIHSCVSPRLGSLE